MAARWLWSVFAAIGLIAASALLWQNHRETTPLKTAASVAQPLAAAPGGPQVSGSAKALEAVTGQAPTREVSPKAHGAVVALEKGGPAVGAVLSWSPVAPLLLASMWDWDEIDFSWWSEATSLAISDADGFVAPESPDLSAGLGSVVWVDLLGFEPLFEVLAPEGSALDGRRYELVERQAVEVQVLDAFGQPLEEAVVDQHGVELRKGLEAPSYVAQLFHRTRSTGLDGTCSVSHFPGRQALVARKGGAVSRPLIVDEATNSAILHVLDSFTIAGTVTRPTSPDLVGEIIPRVTISSQNGNLWRELGTAVAQEGEAWGPLKLPCEPGAQYRAEVHGVGVIPDETFFPAPAPGESVVLHLEAKAGIAQWFVAYADEQRIPLLGTRATVSWLEEGTWRAVSADARPDGFIAALGIRPGLVKAVISCPGYTSAVFPLQELPLPTPLTLSIILTRGTTISGRVVRNGEPVPDFEITYWPSDDLDLRSSKSYQDRSDGSFLIEDAFPEPMGIVAAAPGSPGSVPLQVEVNEGGLQGLEVELVDLMPGSGQVVKKSDGEPLSEAAVQPYVFGGGSPVSPWGPPVPVEPDGRFNLQAFREGDSCLLATAPGYGPRQVSAKSEGGHVDFGVIALEHSIDLRVEIGCAPEPGNYRLERRGIIALGTSTFERDKAGNLVGWVTGVPIGFNEFRLQYPDGDEAHLSVDVHEDTEVLRFSGGGGALVVQLEQGQVSDTHFTLYIDQEAENVRAFSRIVSFEPEGSARVAGLLAGPVRLSLRDLDVTLATTTATIRDGETTLVTMSPGGSSLLLRVLDTEGDPVSGTTVRLYGTEAVKDSEGGLTDEKGEFLLRGLNPGSYILHITNPSLGLRPDEEIVVGSEKDMEREVVLDGRASLELLLADDDLPLAGLTCRLLDRTGRNMSSAVLSNEEGRATIPRLAPGGYRLSVTGSAVWKLDTPIDVQVGAGLRTLEIRRLGDLRLRVLNADGVPVKESEVSLAFEPTGEAVQEWIGAKLVAGPDELTTDKHGEIQITGLPRGVYSWRCGASQGSLLVVAGKESLALISLE